LAEAEALPLELEASRSFNRGRRRPSRSASYVELDGPSGRKMPTVAGDVSEQEAFAFFDPVMRSHPPRYPADLLVMRVVEDRFWNVEKSPGRTSESCHRYGRRPGQGSEDSDPGIIVSDLAHAFTHFAARSSVAAPALRSPRWWLEQEVPGMTSTFAGGADSSPVAAFALHAFLRSVTTMPMGDDLSQRRDVHSQATELQADLLTQEADSHAMDEGQSCAATRLDEVPALVEDVAAPAGCASPDFSGRKQPNKAGRIRR
jgi:hypothetical protein